ncbi:MAG: 30S ribosomal protein S9 [Dehalococcoidia bacterium]
MANDLYYHGTGRRKCAVARVRLFPGAGPHIVNERPMEDVFPRTKHRYSILAPLRVTESLDKFHAQVKVAGGGASGWADAIALGVARALIKADENAHKPLRKAGLLTRDARVKERKKYGLKRARKAPQFTKR